MNKLSPVLQAVIVIVGILTLAFMLWEPHVEGRNVNATAFQIYFNDPLLAYAYIASVPFFIALYQAFNLLGSLRLGTDHIQPTKKAIRNIKYCSISLIIFVAVGEIFIILGDSDDRIGGFAIGLFIVIIAVAMFTTSSFFERYILSS